MTVTPEKLHAAIVESNKTKALVRELYALRAGDSVYLDSAETMDVLTAGTSMPRAEFNALLTELIAELKACGETVKPGRRLMLLSGHAETPAPLEALESQGALVVIDDAANGIRMAEHDIAETGDPLEALCDFYFNVKTPMPRVFGTQDRRFDDYLRLFDEYKADGIVSARVTMCDLWAFEQYMLAETLRKKGIPGPELEINYIMDGVGQIRTRVQAFVENLPRRCA